MDLLVGLWAQRHVPQAAEDVLADFEVIAVLTQDAETKWLSMACPIWALREEGETTLTSLWSPCLQAVLDQENPDLYKWLTSQEVAPAEMQQNQAFKVSSQRLLLCCIHRAFAGIDATIHAAGTACER